MLKRLFFGLLLMFTATPAMAQMTAAEFADKLAPAVGKPLGETNITVAAVKADGSLAILTLDSPDWGGQRGNVTQVFSATFCGGEETSNFFDKLRLRIDTLENGKGLVTGTVVDKCPPAEAE